MRNEPSEPSPEEFGVTADQVARAPLPFVSAHRWGLFSGAYGIIFAGIFAVLWSTTSSASAAAFFAVVIVAAGSILLVPLLICVLCASERAERRRLCREVPDIAACNAFRDALEAARAHRRPSTPLIPSSRWHRLSPPEQRRQLVVRLEGTGLGIRTSPGSEHSGWDLLVEGRGRRDVLRCWSGPGAAPPSAARELIACLVDGLGDHGWVVSTTGPSPAFVEAAGHHPVEVIHPDTLLDRLTAPRSQRSESG